MSDEMHVIAHQDYLSFGAFGGTQGEGAEFVGQPLRMAFLVMARAEPSQVTRSLLLGVLTVTDEELLGGYLGGHINETQGDPPPLLFTLSNGPRPPHHGTAARTPAASELRRPAMRGPTPGEREYLARFLFADATYRSGAFPFLGEDAEVAMDSERVAEEWRRWWALSEWQRDEYRALANFVLNVAARFFMGPYGQIRDRGGRLIDAHCVAMSDLLPPPPNQEDVHE